MMMTYIYDDIYIYMMIIYICIYDRYEDNFDDSYYHRCDDTYDYRYDEGYATECNGIM